MIFRYYTKDGKRFFLLSWSMDRAFKRAIRNPNFYYIEKVFGGI